MNEIKELTYKPTIFSEEHKLIFHPEYIELYKSPGDKNPIRFSKLEIDAFRFGVKWLRGYKVTFGRIYCIDIRDATENIIKIRMTSVYKIRVKKLHGKYNAAINIILQYFISEIVGQCLKTFKYKQPLSILNVRFDQSGIILNEKYKISWNDVDIRTHTRFVAISTRRKSDIYQAFDYIEEWNTLVLYNVIRLILKSKNLLNY